MKEALFRAVLAIPCATFAGGFFGAVFVVLPAFFCRDYIQRFTPVSDEVTMLDGKVVSYALSKIEISILGLILGGLTGIVLSSTISMYSKEPLPKRALVFIGFIAGIASLILAIIISSTGY